MERGAAGTVTCARCGPVQPVVLQDTNKVCPVCCFRIGERDMVFINTSTSKMGDCVTKKQGGSVVDRGPLASSVFRERGKKRSLPFHFYFSEEEAEADADAEAGVDEESKGGGNGMKQEAVVTVETTSRMVRQAFGIKQESEVIEAAATSSSFFGSGHRRRMLFVREEDEDDDEEEGEEGEKGKVKKDGGYEGFKFDFGTRRKRGRRKKNEDSDSVIGGYEEKSVFPALTEKRLAELTSAIQYVTAIVNAYFSARGVLGPDCLTVRGGVRTGDVNIIVDTAIRVLLRDPSLRISVTSVSRQILAKSRPVSVFAHENMDAVVVAIVAIVVYGPTCTHVLTPILLVDVQQFLATHLAFPVMRVMPARMKKPRRAPITASLCLGKTKKAMSNLTAPGNDTRLALRTITVDYMKLCKVFIDATQSSVALLAPTYPGAQPAFGLPTETKVCVRHLPLFELEEWTGVAVVGSRLLWVRPWLDPERPRDVHGRLLLPVSERQAAQSFEFRATKGRALFVMQCLGVVDTACDHAFSSSPFAVACGCEPGVFTPTFMYCVFKLVMACGCADGSAMATFSAALLFVLAWLVIPVDAPYFHGDAKTKTTKPAVASLGAMKRLKLVGHRVLLTESTTGSTGIVELIHRAKKGLKHLKHVTNAILGVVGCQSRSVDTVVKHILETMTCPSVFCPEQVASRVAVFVHKNFGAVLTHVVCN